VKAFLVGVATSFRCAARGIRIATTGRNFRLMLVAATVVVIAAIALDVSATSWAILLVCVGSVLGAEAMNTAIERLADRVDRGYDRDIGDVKDLAAGGVLLVSMLTAAVGVVVLWPYVVD
jgi:diacylglycerol kinase